jgi:hypothetical protein
MQAVSFSDIFKNPKTQSIAPPCKNTPIPGLSEVPGRCRPEYNRLRDPAAPDYLLQVFRRNTEEPDM